MNGTSAPSPRATSAISGLSDDTISRSSCRAFCAASMVCAINGLPPRQRMFFLGRLREPPRARITPNTPLLFMSGAMCIP